MALIKMGEQSRSMMQPLTTELHLAGDFICQKNPMQMIKPYHDQEIKKGTEGFTIEYIDPHSVKLIEMQNDHNLLVTNEQLFKEGDQLVLTDCKTYDIFTVQSVWITL